MCWPNCCINKELVKSLLTDNQEQSAQEAAAANQRAQEATAATTNQRAQEVLSQTPSLPKAITTGVVVSATGSYSDSDDGDYDFSNQRGSVLDNSDTDAESTSSSVNNSTHNSPEDKPHPSFEKNSPERFNDLMIFNH